MQRILLGRGRAGVSMGYGCGGGDVGVCEDAEAASTVPEVQCRRWMLQALDAGLAGEGAGEGRARRVFTYFVTPL